MWIELEHSLGEGTLSFRKYNALIGATILWGLVINAIICKFFADVVMSINPIALIIGYFISAIAGILIARSSMNAFVSFIGYNLVVLPIGAILSLAVSQYNPALVANAMFSTAVVVTAMLVLAVVWPGLFEGLGGTLFAALLLSIVVELVLMLFGMDLAIMDWVVLIIFCGYIGYDWNRANCYAPTADNAVDAALELYLDIINIFIRILSIMGRSNSRSGRN